MKKIVFLSIFCCYCCTITFAQKNVKTKTKYCIQTTYTNYNKLTPKRALLQDLDKYKTYPVFDKRNKIRGIIGYADFLYDTIPENISSTIRDIFKVTNIEKKKNNYQKKGNKLAQKTIYLIDIERFEGEEIYPQYIRLISPQTSVSGQKRKIKVGEHYEMEIFSFFEKDCCRPIIQNKDTVYRIRQPNQSVLCFFFEDIWVVHMDILSYNLFETPNLKGLYYIKPE